MAFTFLDDEPEPKVGGVTFLDDEPETASPVVGALVGATPRNDGSQTQAEAQKQYEQAAEAEPGPSTELSRLGIDAPPVPSQFSMEELSIPFKAIPHGENETVIGKVLNKGIDLVNALQSPFGVISAAAGSTPALMKPVATAFGAPMLKEGATRAADAFLAETPDERKQAAVDAAAGLGLGTLAMGVSGARPRAGGLLPGETAKANARILDEATKLADEAPPEVIEPIEPQPEPKPSVESLPSSLSAETGKVGALVRESTAEPPAPAAKGTTPQEIAAEVGFDFDGPIEFAEGKIQFTEKAGGVTDRATVAMPKDTPPEQIRARLQAKQGEFKGETPELVPAIFDENRNLLAKGERGSEHRSLVGQVVEKNPEARLDQNKDYGFTDQYGRALTREEAWAVAKKANLITEEALRAKSKEKNPRLESQDLKPKEGEPSAVQEPSTTEVLQRPSEGTPETGGGRGPLERGEQGPSPTPKDQPPQPPQAPEVAEGGKSPTGIRNAIVDEQRVKRGLPPRMGPLRRSFGQSWERAVSEADKDPAAGTKLVSELNAKPRPLEDWESALLAHEQVTRENAFDNAVDAVNSATDDLSRADATTKLERAREDVQAIYDAGQAAGTKSGQSLAARKLLVNEDYSLARMEATKRAVANDGKPLTAKQAAEVKAQHEEIQRLKKKLDEYETSASTRKAEETFSKLIRETRQQAKESVSRGQKATNFLDEQIAKARERLKAKSIKDLKRSAESGALDTGLIDYAIIGAAHIAKGVVKASDYAAAMVKEFGEGIRPHLDELFKRSKDYHKAAMAFSGKGEPKNIESLLSSVKAGEALDSKVVYDLARSHAQQGVGREGGKSGLAALMKAVHEDIKKVDENVTLREVGEAFSEYGKVKLPSKEQVAQQLSEARRLEQLVLAIEDVQKGQAPKKSGQQRNEPTQAIREEMKKLQAEMKKAGIETGDPETQLKSTNAARATALRNQIADLDKQLQTGEKPTKGPKRPETPEVERLRAERDAMKEQLRELEQGEAKSPEEITLGRYKKILANRTKELRERLARGDFAKKERKTVELDKEGADLRFEFEKAKQAFNEALFRDQLAKRTVPQKILGSGAEVLNTSRALITSADLSAVLRQGGFIAIGNPVRAAKAVPSMFRAMASERAQFRINEEITSRPNAPLYKQSGLYLSEHHNHLLSKMEEAYMSRWADKIPGVGASQRAYTTFLNRLRADSFDAMAASLGRGGKVTLEEARAISNFINVATGRGDLGRANAAATTLNTVFFAPKYAASRFQLLAGQPLYRGNARTRQLIAKEYAKFLIGATVIYALARMAGSDNLETDPRSSDFGKIRFGDTRVDPLAGLQQVTVLGSRIATGESKGGTGKVNPIRGDVPFAKGDASANIGRFLRTKLSPAIGTGLDLAAGRNVVGEKVTPASAAVNLVTPLTFRDIYDLMQEQGVPRGTALTILSLFGMGVQTYDTKK